MVFVSIKRSNYAAVAEIYKLGIAAGYATFETEIPDFNTWDKKHLSYCRFALKQNSKILGWGALSKVSDRNCYKGVAEVSVYVHPEAQGKSIGTQLLLKLIDESEKNGIWTLQGGIMEGNIASLKLHKKCGFRTIGYREKIGCLNGQWKNKVILERRSKIVGIS
ncbi:GNAT family N-acetyltransferase [Winogradskyella sp.]|uniref:GNAT family N-acetyltransferase n=1 Tax=Winogradskyella sp. TaxID=1883156 RepID=UPI003BAAF171